MTILQDKTQHTRFPKSARRRANPHPRKSLTPVNPPPHTPHVSITHIIKIIITTIIITIPTTTIITITIRIINDYYYVI